MLGFFVLILGAFILFTLRNAWYRNNISYKLPRVLMYHMVTEHLSKSKSKFNRLRVKPSEFEKQLKWLKKNNWTTFTMTQLLSLSDIPEKSVVLTFDDGYKDNYKYAFKLLQKYNMNATIYLVVNRFNQNWAVDKDKSKSSDELNNEEMLSHDEINEMVSSGLIEIGSHTLNHTNLATASLDIKEQEIIKSKKILEEQYNISCDSFAYPFGFYNENDWKIVKDAGYTNATTVNVGIEDITKVNKFLLKRIMISGRQGLFAFILKIKKGRNR
jgi:peptidoglycan/xylan/chitin deacetylase (PgdA/CDA1 family)